VFADDPLADLVRHFLIEPTPKGVRLKGCSTEPVFGELAFYSSDNSNYNYNTVGPDSQKNLMTNLGKIRIKCDFGKS